jgi:hypothetical protein
VKRKPPPPPLEELLSGVPADDVQEFKAQLRAQRLDPQPVAGILRWLKEREQMDSDYAPVERRAVAFSQKRERLRKRLLGILTETVNMYKTELVHAARPGVLDQQPGYRAAAALLEALTDMDDPIVGPFMTHTPGLRRGPRERPERHYATERLRDLKVPRQLAGLLVQGIIKSKKKK